ncbi:hypothetical protein KPL71_023837 [Citrus sinensis]|uniref:Uncharacterized protein n=1 Tax=Citrus sinensis TaxID=2711 RepID=A0ACB8ILD8_CITSI|nr:hypothetical protein KPL71_023837 [Citrus sinensis]
MLDTRFKQYQDAVIGTVLTTLHAGSVLLTFYPNFNLSLQDPNLPTTLKVQVQIQGAEQISSAKIATLHHQLVYKLQNHALDLPTPEHHSDTLMVLAESDQIPTIIQIPRQIPRHELIKLMPLEWISNYEQFHNNTAPIQTSDSMFERRQDGTVRMTFKPPPSAPQEPPRLSFTYSSMITAVQTAQEDLPITGFNFEGYPVYPAKHNGHFLWDAPGSGMCDPTCPCWDDWEEDDYYVPRRKRKPKRKKPPVSCPHYDPKPPPDPPSPPAPLPYYQKELQWIAKHCRSETPSPIPLPTPPLTSMMFSSTSSDYSSSFPPLELHTDSHRNVVSKPFIPSPITSAGHLEPPKPFESVLNWQTQNARAQNDTLLNINSKVENINLRTEQLETKVDSICAQMQQIHQNLQSRIIQLDSELRAMLAQRYYGPEFDQKEREIRRLKAELAQIESDKQRPTLFTTSPPIPSIGPTYHPFASMLSPTRQYDPSKLFCMTHTLFRDNPLPPPPQPKPKLRPQPRPVTFHIPGQHSPGHTPASPPVPSPPTESQPHSQSKDKQPMHQFSAHTTSDSGKSNADITRILMAQPDQPPPGQTSHTELYVDIPSEVEEEMPESSATNQPPPTQAHTSSPSQKSSNGPWFNFDDLPSHKWRDRLNEMSAWIDLQMLRPGATTQSVLREFATRFTGALRDWFDSLGNYRQLQLFNYQKSQVPLQLSMINSLETPLVSHGIMLSAKKSTIATNIIKFLVSPTNSPTLEHLLDPDKATSLTWTLLEWFSPIPWWRKKLQQLSEIYNLERMPASEAQMFTSVFIIHRPYFQHPDTKLFWTQDQVYEWFTAPNLAVIENEIQDVLHNYLCQLNHQPPPLKDIFHTSLGPQHDLLMIPTPSAISKPKSTGIIIKEEKPDYTDFLFQDPWEDFLPLSQQLQQFPQPSMNELGSSSQPPKADTTTKPSKVDKATQTSPRPGYRRDCPYPPCRGPHCYTHLHLGDIRLILTLHGRKGLPVTARLAMLDTRFKQYQDAVIGTVLTTLHAGSVLLTFDPNFNFSLQDPNLPTTLKVQVQIQGAEQISSAKIATLHHQLVYRLKNHALDLPTPEHHSDTLMVLAESDRIPTIIQIPRQIPCHELIKLMHLEWISNYEQFHNNTAPIQTSDSVFERRQDGTVRMTFKPPPSAPQEPPRLSFTYSSMITAVQTDQEDLPITGFNSEGYPVYPAKHNGHFLWDAPGSCMKKPLVSCRHYDPKPPPDPPSLPAPLPYYQKELQWIAKHCRSETPSPIPLPTPPPTCMMFSSTSSDYSSSFPPLEPHTDSHRNVVSKPLIPSPITSTGHLEPPKPFESVLNWQTQNARAQNDTLLNINSKVENISLRTEQLETKVDSISAQMQQIHQNLQSRITQLDSELRAMLAQRYYGPEFDQKEREIRRLKAELAQIESDKQRPTFFTTLPHIPSIGPTYHPFPSMLSPTRQLTQTSDSEKSYADITRILMAQPDQPPPGQTSHTEPYVDIPSEVEEEMPESSATNQPPPAQAHTSSPSATTQSVLREFATRFTGALRDWFDSLGNYRQLQFVQLPEVSSAIAIIHDQFLGDPSAVFEAARRDYLNMKCCSLNATDLDFHYKRMPLLFFKLNGFNEPTLKHVFLASLPDELQPDIQRQLTASNLSLDNISLGKIFQLAKTCLNKLCEQKQFFKELLKDKEPFQSACKKPYLQIKCKQKKDCDCSPKKKRHFKKFRNPEFSSRPRRSRKPYRFFRKKSSSSIDFKRRKSSRCFICKKKGHFAKDCPHKREKSIRLVEHLQATTDYSPEKDELEFYFSEQDEPNDETMFALQNSSDDSDSDQSQIIFHQQLLSFDTTILIPSIKLQILPSKFQRPIPAIGLIDTGAQRSMLNPHLLPPEYWTDYEEHFKAVNGKLFTTSLITKKPIGIQIFPNYVIWTKVIGSTLPNKDLLLGFDIFHQIKHLQILPNGIRVKSMFKPFTDILKLYNLSETPQPYQDISNKLLSFCLESHSEFTHPNPLWKNKSFFIKLPFKLNEDINPTKATHPGMSPSDLLLAQHECSQLLAQGLIEPTNSQWACQAFYVEKHSEIIRGKKRLVIDYQPLNMFLQDDKFPLPHRQRMFTFLKNAQIFSKFDLKSGFWQLGIEPSERYKTAFSRNTHCPRIASLSRSALFQKASSTVSWHHHYTHHLSALLKKKPPEWNTDHTNAVTTLKQIAQNPPPLKLITDGKRILQTDASEDSWGAILLEETNGKEHFIAYASVQFSDTQKHYHSVFKEILAVKILMPFFTAKISLNTL